MSRFLRFAQAHGWSPDQIGQEHAQRFAGDLEHEVVLDDRDEVVEETRRAWNRAVDTVPGWPRYAPQYGGYCAWVVTHGYTAKIDPAAWSIVDGKLYLNYSMDVQTQWSADAPGNIAKGDANWPKIKADLAG